MRPNVSLVSLTDPACAVSNYRDPFPHNKNVDVLYFPKSAGATIVDPQALSLHLVFEYGYFDGDRRTIPFTRRDDGVWIATVPLEERIPSYAVYWIEDQVTKQADTNHGRYFDVRFCDVYGERPELGVKYEALSYTGILTAYGIDRGVDFAKAIDILEEHIHPPTRGANLIADLWRYELSARGDTQEARKDLLAEINKFIADHSRDGFGLVDAVNFVANADWVPTDTTEALFAAVEKTNSDRDFNPRAFVLSARATRERNFTKQAALDREIIAKYPETSEAYAVRRNLFFIAKDLPEREALYRKIVEKSPYDVGMPIAMAKAYVDANQNLPEGLRLLDEAQHILDGQTLSPGDDRPHYPPEAVRVHSAEIAITRSRILVAMGKPEEALAILLPRKKEFKLPSSYFLLGQAFEGSGNAKGAVDAYMEAAIRPWSRQEQASAALQQLWDRAELGTHADLQHRLEQAISSEFARSDYAPQLLQHPAPAFDLITTRGERLSNAELKGKTIILNLWAVWCGPCLSELQPLQDFQRGHPEVVLLTVIGDDTDQGELERIIRNKKLTSLRIARAPHEFWQRFGAFGFPNTYVIDGDGAVRVQHLGGIPDVERFLSADIKAIKANPTSHPATRKP